MKVSVLIITYNHEAYIGQAVESILAQRTNFKYEIVVGDDCSTDKTREILLDLNEKHPGKMRLIFRAVNLGMMCNFIDTLKNCTGEYVAILEGDDYWMTPLKLQKQVDVMEINPQYSMCGGIARIVTVDPNGNEQEVGRFQSKIAMPFYELKDVISSYFIHSSTFLLRSGLVKYPDWFENVPNGDTALIVLHAEKGAVGYVDELLSTYRLHQSGTWTGVSILEKYKLSKITYDAINKYFNSKYAKELARREFRDLKASCHRLLIGGKKNEARALYWDGFNRLKHRILAPLIGMIGMVYGFKLIQAWHSVSMFLAFRTRIRRLLLNRYGNM